MHIVAPRTTQKFASCPQPYADSNQDRIGQAILEAAAHFRRPRTVSRDRTIGRPRWWRFKYRFAGKEKRISLGVYPEIGIKEAREPARRRAQEARSEHRSVRATQGRSDRPRRKQREHVQGDCRGVDSSQCEQVVNRQHLQDHAVVRARYLSLDRRCECQRHSSAGAIAGMSTHRGAQRERNDASGAAELRARFSIRGGDRACRSRPVPGFDRRAGIRSCFRVNEPGCGP